MQDILKVSIYMTFLTLAATAKAGQVAVINPSSGGGVAIAPTVSVPTVTVSTPTATVSTPTATVSTPTATISTPAATTVSTVSVSTNTVTTATTAGTLARIVSVLTNATSTVTQETGAPAASTTSENNSGGSSEATSSTPSSVSGYAPQILATMQSVNVNSFTPQQANTLISIIEAQLSQPSTPISVRQALTVEKAKLAAIASN